MFEKRESKNVDYKKVQIAQNRFLIDINNNVCNINNFNDLNVYDISSI